MQLVANQPIAPVLYSDAITDTLVSTSVSYFRVECAEWVILSDSLSATTPT